MESSRDQARDKDREYLTRIFNTAMISTAVDGAAQDISKRLQALLQTPAFQAILHATKNLAVTQNMSEKEAAELLISTFRKLDEVWKHYVHLEGIQKLRGPKT